MAWIKRNLIFVICVAVGVLLTAFCGYLLYNAISANATANDDYQTKLNGLKELQQKPVTPSKENIQAAKEDQARMEKFLTEFRRSFAPFQQAPAEDEKGFKTYLEHTLARFRSEATNADVMVPPDYAFSFSGLIGKLTYPPTNIQPWMEQMQEIDAILNIVYAAKVNSLIGLQRVPVSPDESSSADCLGVASVSNQWGVVTPYKIAFRGFSTEIAAVLDGFARSSNCFIVKVIDVVNDKGGDVSTDMNAAPMIENRAMPMQMAPAPRVHATRGGGSAADFFGGGGGSAPAPVYAARPVVGAPSVPVTILSESPLTVNLTLDVVKLKSAEHH